MRAEKIAPSTVEKSDREVRSFIYRFLLRSGRAPSTVEIGRGLSLAPRQALAALRRLEKGHALVLQEGWREILRAAPFWAVPTAFQVVAGKRSWWGSCIWDALGIPAMLKQDTRIFTECPCCSTRMELAVRKGRLLKAQGVIHFAVPARRWYENIIFT